MKIGNREFDTENHMYIMGILNITPDSFSDGGKYNHMDNALFRIEEMMGEGMDILDVGGESTRPGHLQITAEEEMERVLPLIEAVKSNYDIPLSLDTYKSVVAAEGVKLGADLINDVYGLMYDGNMAKVVAQGGVACCLMHNRGQAVYNDFIGDVMKDLEAMLNQAATAGIDRNKIILDPGIGFAKNLSQNLEIIRRLKEVKALGYPLLLGVSRKSFIGEVLNLPVEERLIGTVAANLFGWMQGCSFIRVHDVREHKEAIKIIEAIQNNISEI